MTVQTLAAIHNDSDHLDTPAARHSLWAQARFFFTQTSPQILLVNFVVVALARTQAAAPTLLDLGVVLAVLAYWPVQEWTAHKFVLHAPPRRIGRWVLDPKPARTHRAHHRQPWIVETTLLPASFVAAMVPIYLVFWWLATPTLATMLSGAATFAGCALVYEWVHYLCHAHYVPRSAYFRQVARNHKLHHFKNERYWYAFTAPALDRWLGTDPPPGKVETSETVRTLGVDDDG